MTSPGAVLVLPTSTAGQQGPVAALVSTAGWAAATERVVGAAWIVTPAGVITAEEARRLGSAPHLASPPTRGWRARIPTVAKTATKDLRQALRARRFDVAAMGPWHDREVRFVWQRHELFHAPGNALATRLGVPSVLFVPATPVWEAARWGVHRPGWTSLAERHGEGPALRGASVVAAGSDEVAEQAVRLGAHPERVLIVPTGVDLDLFPTGAAAERSAAAVRSRLGLDGRFVVGWAGSFRRFHALHLAVDALAEVDGATLLLVGDGPERASVEQLARDRGVPVVATGTVAHAELPAHLGVFDVALVQAPSAENFHYSPLKVAEYLAAGRAVVAPEVPQLTERLVDGRDAVLVPPGDRAALAAALRSLRDDPEARARIGAAGRRAAAADWTWDRQVQRIVDRLDQQR